VSCRIQHSAVGVVNFFQVWWRLRYQSCGSGTCPSFFLCRFASTFRRSAPPMYVSERPTGLHLEKRRTNFRPLVTQISVVDALTIPEFGKSFLVSKVCPQSHMCRNDFNSYTVTKNRYSVRHLLVDDIHVTASRCRDSDSRNPHLAHR
jgi:hypothetical protein